ncbi:zinc finger phd-type [Holotrichia oblita]|uniref:Zinc finger phd-type n=1 Tax=Holotrichia oblita TaxID=644536 RepID=A0ACB9SJ88_HOLOL|nr:zinc finger phd-type [Holotrichia oblita]
MSISNIQSGFKSTGIFPFDPSVIPEVAFAPSMLTFRSLDETIEQKNGNDSSGDELPLSPPISVKKDTLDEKANDTKTSLSKKETESVAREHDTTSKSPKIKVLDITVIKPPPDEANCNTNKFRQLLPTPDFVIRRQVTPRRKAINYKAQLLKRDLFSERSSPKPTKTKQKLTNSEHASQNCRKGSDISDWMCSICAEKRVEDMRRCAVCHSWVHEDCVGLTADDVEEFVCPNCSP